MTMRATTAVPRPILRAESSPAQDHGLRPTQQPRVGPADAWPGGESAVRARRRIALKRPQDHETLEPSFEPFSRRRDRRKPRGRLRAAELLPEEADAVPVPEIAWMLERGYLDAVEGELKSGKEATVYLGRTRVGLAAVKVYRDLTVRSFKNDARYRAGRYIGDARIEKAIAQRTAAGRRAQGRLWAAHEYAMLWRLHDAGVNVPEPLVGPDPSDIGAAGEVVLMRYVGDEAGPAPRLSDLRLPPDEARRAFDEAAGALATMWRSGIVHADYSTYNLLWWHDVVVVIDLPQAVEADHREARELLARDAASLCATFRAHGVEESPERVLRAVLAGG
jgi:RIO kinase 1